MILLQTFLSPILIVFVGFFKVSSGSWSMKLAYCWVCCKEGFSLVTGLEVVDAFDDEAKQQPAISYHLFLLFI